MIKLICPHCDSEKINYHNCQSEQDTFKCEDCEEEFSLSEAGWSE